MNSVKVQFFKNRGPSAWASDRSQLVSRRYSPATHIDEHFSVALTTLWQAIMRFLVVTLGYRLEYKLSESRDCPLLSFGTSQIYQWLAGGGMQSLFVE